MVFVFDSAQTRPVASTRYPIFCAGEYSSYARTLTSISDDGARWILSKSVIPYAFATFLRASFNRPDRTDSSKRDAYMTRSDIRVFAKAIANYVFRFRQDASAVLPRLAFRPPIVAKKSAASPSPLESRGGRRARTELNERGAELGLSARDAAPFRIITRASTLSVSVPSLQHRRARLPLRPPLLPTFAHRRGIR